MKQSNRIKTSALTAVLGMALACAITSQTTCASGGNPTGGGGGGGGGGGLGLP